VTDDAGAPAVTPPALPTGTVTFFRTDVEGSMRMASLLGSRWDALNTEQLALTRKAVADQGGHVVRTEGDALFAVFADARRAVAAAIAVQRAIAGHAWPPEAPVQVRIGLHSGEAHLAGDDYGGFDVNRAARIAAAGHGGQVVLSDPTRALVATDLPEGATVRDLGRHALKDVPHPERLFQLDVPGLRSDFPPLRTGQATLGNVPARLTSFVGRDEDLAMAGQLFLAGRLLTITGPGGIGKTSVAIELARRFAPDVEGGAWLVPLDAVAEPAGIPGAVARALGLYDGPAFQAGDGVARQLAGREVVLVLDNFEHLLDGASWVAGLLQASAGVRVIVTSRAPLRIAGEQEYPLAPLAATEDHSSPAIRLFVDRARAARPGWDPGDGWADVREICDRLDGLPLGIELAAARVGVLTPAAIRDRLAARLPLPGQGPRGLPDRQRTLDGAIAWSYGLLGEGQRRLLRRLAVFDGDFDVEQARDLASADGPAAGGADLLDDILELVDHSLLMPVAIPDAGPRMGGLRFRMLETIQAFALRELAAAGEEDDARAVHAAVFLALAEAAARHLPGGEQARWLDRLFEDHANLHAALAWSIDHGRVETAQRLAYALWRYWQLGGHMREGRELVDRVVELAPEEPTRARMWAVMAAGSIAYWQAESERAHRLYEEQLLLARQIGDLPGEADATFNLSATHFIAGERQETIAYLHAARALYERLGDEVGASRTYWGEHNFLAYERRFDEALPALAESARRYEANGDVMYQALAAGSMAWMCMVTGDRSGGIEWGIRSVAATYALRDVASTTLQLAGGAILLLEWERWMEAATLLAAYEHLSDVFGLKPPAGIGYVIELFRPVDRTLERLHADEFREASERGRAMSLDEAVTFALELLEQLRQDEVRPPAVS
jgi:predicted ATPase/class 3 adenylate cyclase